mgnify:CR=1 FL=1
MPGTSPKIMPIAIPNEINISNSMNIDTLFKLNAQIINHVWKPDPKKIEQMMKKLNINVNQIEAEEVIIKQKNKNIIISNPEVMVTNMMGRDIYQISGEISESEQISEQDIQMVIEKTGKDRDTVIKKLEELNNDLVRAIMELKED